MEMVERPLREITWILILKSYLRVLKTDQLRIQWVSPKVLLQILMKFQIVIQNVSTTK